MTKFLLKIVLFFVIVAILDLTSVWPIGLLKKEAKGGQTYKNEYIKNVCKDDILVLGSSRAAHHYVPQIISDSLGYSCYNCGQEGNGIVAAYARYKLVTSRKKPKLVLYEVTPDYDYLLDNGYSSYLGVIREYTDNKDVRNEYLAFSDELERLRLISNMYRNNSRIITILKDCIRPTKVEDGYEPLFGSMGDIKRQEKDNDFIVTIDSLKFDYFEKLIVECKNDYVPLLFVVSPKINKIETFYQPAIELCKKYDVLFLNNMTCNGIIENGDYFQDPSHLNNEGAIAYTQYIIPQLRRVLK